MQLLSFITVLLATIIPTSYTLKCYQCNSAEIAACADVEANDTTSAFLQDCTGNYEGNMPFCRKIVTKVMEGEHKRVIRKCGWVLDEDRAREDYCKQSDSDFVLKKSCACFTDSCNTGSYINSSPNLFICVIVSLILIYNNLR